MTNSSNFFSQSIEEYERYLQDYLTHLVVPDPILKEAIEYVLTTPSKKFGRKWFIVQATYINCQRRF